MDLDTSDSETHRSLDKYLYRNGSDNSTLEIINEEKPITNENWRLFVCLIGLSTFFLLIAVIIYILLRDKQNVHGWTQFSYLVSFLMFNIVFFPALFPGLVRGSEITLFCFVLSVSNQFFFICSKTWLLVIGFDITWNLWKLEIPMDNEKRLDRFVKYSVFGWILPAALVAAGVSLNLAYQRELRSGTLKTGLWTPVPDYGYLHCRLPNWSIWEIFVFTNCLTHFAIFALIILLIVRHRYQARQAIQAASTSSHHNHHIIELFVKLFFVVGISWSYIAIQDLLQAGNINTQQSWGWHVFRIVFFLQGVFISMVYVCNTKTLRLLQEKFPGLKKLTARFQKPLTCFCPAKCSDWRRASIQAHLLMRSKKWTLDSSDSHHKNDQNDVARNRNCSFSFWTRESFSSSANDNLGFDDRADRVV